jgi:hypothetical protein
VLVYDLLAAAVLLAWFIASVVVQRESGPLTLWLLQFDVFGLLPNCRFFAPKPMSHDLILFTRCTETEKGAGSWVPFVSRPKRPWCFIWNPEHRIRKTIHDLTEGLQRYEGEPELRRLTYAYLALLEAASSACAGSGTHVQFVIAASAGFEDQTPNLVFVSHIHRLPRC